MVSSRPNDAGAAVGSSVAAGSIASEMEALNEELLTKIATSLDSRQDALSLSLTSSAFASVFRRDGFRSLWTAAHPFELRLKRMKQKFDDLDSVVLEAAVGRDSYCFPPLLKRRRSSPDGAAAQASACQPATTALLPRQSCSPDATATEATPCYSAPELSVLPCPAPSLSRQRRRALEESFTQSRLRRLREQFAELDKYELEAADSPG